MNIKLSPSSIAEYNECPRCFWLARHEEIKKPRGIFPSLPGGIDRILKTYYDAHRAAKKLPPELVGKVDGTLFPDQETLRRWRFWRTAMVSKVNSVEISGMLDDLLVNKQKQHSVLDYKTKGSAPKPGDTERYYQHQSDIYDMLLQDNGLKTTGKAYFVYYFPQEAQGNGLIQFNVEPKMIETSAERARDLIKRAIKCLRGTIPEPAYGCELCTYIETRERRIKQLRTAAAT